ncbi:MAG: hypothetical protein WCF57_12300 [Pyrinomonadaceae bacterium]
MADEDKIRKQMEFILEQQAQFGSDIQQLRETQAATESILGRLAAATAAGFKELTEKVSAVTDAQIRTEEHVSSLAESVKALAQRVSDLADSQAHTDQRLNVIIDIISEGRNGRSQN